MFNKPIGDLGTDDLAELLAAAPIENVRLEFKRHAPGKEQLLKKLSGFANTFGGYLIVGADEQDGRLSALPGVDPCPNYRQTVTQHCALGITPFIDTFVSEPIPVPDDNGKVCYVIYVPESDRTPHFLNGRKGVWVRVDEHSHRAKEELATYQEIMGLSSRRRLLVDRHRELIDRARSRFMHFVSQLPPRSDGSLLPLAQICVGPRYPSQKYVDHAGLLRIAREIRVDWRGGHFPPAVTPLSQHESALLLNDAATSPSLVEVNAWGIVSQSLVVARSIDRSGNYWGIHLNAFLGGILVLLDYAKTINSRLGVQGPLEVFARIDHVRGLPVYGFGNGFPEPIASSRFDDSVAVTLSTSTDQLETTRDAVAIQLIEMLLYALGWGSNVHPADREQLSDSLLREAYGYNFWNPNG
jgi:hypothetical protein